MTPGSISSTCSPQIKTTTPPVLWGFVCYFKKANLFSLTLKVKSNTTFILTYETHGWSPLQQGCLYPQSTHLPGAPDTGERAWLPLPATQVSTHSQTLVAKTEHSTPEMTHPHVHKCVFLSDYSLSELPTLRVGWVTPESKHHTPPFGQPPSKGSFTQKMSKISPCP